MMRQTMSWTCGICVVLTWSAAGYGAEDPVGWARLTNNTREIIDVQIEPVGMAPRDHRLNAGESLPLTDAKQYRLKVQGLQPVWTIDATPPDELRKDASLKRHRASDLFDVGRFARFPLGAWQVRHYHVADENGQRNVYTGIHRTVLELFAKEFRDSIEDYGLDWKQLPKAKDLNALEDEPGAKPGNSAALESAYRDLSEDVLGRLLEKHLQTTPRSWNGLSISSTFPEFESPEASGRKNPAIKLTVQMIVPGGVSEEVAGFCRSAIAMAFGIRTDELRLMTEVNAPSAANAPLRAEFVDREGKPLIEKVRGVVLNHLGSQGLRIQLPVEIQGNDLEFVSEWKHGATAVPAAFANASIRSRLKVKCSFRAATTYDSFRMPASCDIDCAAEIETKAKSADARKFQRIGSYSGFATSLFSPDGGNATGNAVGTAKELTIEEQVWRIEASVTKLLSNREQMSGDLSDESEDQPFQNRPSPDNQPIERRAKKTATRFLGVNFHICKDGLVHVDSVVAGSPATKCFDSNAKQQISLEANDHILAIDGIDVKDDDGFRQAVRQSGATAVLTVKDSRDGRIRRLKVSLE